MDKETMHLMNFNNETWEYVKDHVDEMGEFLSTYEKNEEIAHLIILSVRLVLSELMLKNDIYKQYPATVYSDEDFVDMVIDSMETKTPNPNDLRANDIYFDEMRRIMWGHIKTKAQRLADILMLVSKEGTTEGIVDNTDGNTFVECLMVIWVECILRKRESQLLEKAYEE